MLSRDELLGLTAHMEWSDALVWGTLLQSHAARDDVKVKGWLHHLHTVQRVYLSHWQHEPMQLAEISTFESVPALAAWGRAGLVNIRMFLAAADDAVLTQPVELPWAKRFGQSTGAVVHPTLAQTVVNLALHSSHHRGQANARLRELGAEPPLVDYVAWIWKGQPDAPWPRNVLAFDAPPTT